MTVPGVNGRIQDGGLGAAPSLGTDTIVVIAPATSGPLGSNGGTNSGPGFTPHTSKSSVAALYTSGPGVELADYLLDITPTPPTVLFYRTPSSIAASLGAIVLTSWTGTAVPTWTGTPLDSSEQLTTIVSGGVVGTPGITFTESWDNGRSTETGPIPLGTISTYVPPASGLTLHLDPPTAALYSSVNAFATTILAHFTDVAGSPAIHAASDTADHAALAAIPAATTYPTAIAKYNACLLYLSTHVASAVYHTAADTVAEAALALLSPAVYPIDVVLGLPALRTAYETHRVLVGAGPVHGSADATNVAAASTATGGTVNAGDTLYVAAVEPMPSAADVATAVATISAGGQRFRCMVVTGTMGVSEFTTIDAALPENGIAYDYFFIIGNTRDYNAMETDAQFTVSMASTWGSIYAAGKRISFFSGFGKYTAVLGAPMQSRQIRRPDAWAVARRFMEYDPSVNVAEVDLGPLANWSIVDANGNSNEHDERVNGGIGGLTDPARLGTLCTFKGKSGAYVCVPWMKSAPGSDYIRIHLRAVMDLACTEAYDSLLNQLNKGIPTNPATGLLDGAKANSIKFVTNGDLKGVLLQKVGSLQRPRASGGGFDRGKSFVTVSTTDNLLVPGTPLNVSIAIVSLVYLELINFTIGFVNPALLALQG